MLSLKRLAFLSFSLFVIACSVKEERSDCPCCLGLDYSECILGNNELVLKAWEEDLSESFRDTPLSGSTGEYREYSVPKCDLTVLSLVGATESADGKIFADSGCQADSIYASLECFSTRCEYCFKRLCLKKQFATLRLSFDAPPVGVTELIVESGTAGVSLLSLEGLPGHFKYNLKKTGESRYEVRLFRQCDEHLSLFVFSETLAGGFKEINLASLLSECGYDWKEESLRDIDLQVDNALGKMTIMISDWNEKMGITVEI